MKASWEMQGIYRIYNTKDGTSYIGRTTNFARRFGEHKKMLEEETHPNSSLQKDYIDFGQDSFFFEIILLLESYDNSRQEEKKLIDIYSKEGRVYNVSNPLDEWNHFTDNSIKIFKGVRKRIAGQDVKFQEIKSHIEESLENSFTKTGIALHPINGVKYFYFDAILERVKSKCSKYIEDVRFGLAVKEILEDNNMRVIHTNQYVKKFMKNGVKLKTNDFIIVHNHLMHELYKDYKDKVWDKLKKENPNFKKSEDKKKKSKKKEGKIEDDTVKLKSSEIIDFLDENEFAKIELKIYLRDEVESREYVIFDEILKKLEDLGAIKGIEDWKNIKNIGKLESYIRNIEDTPYSIVSHTYNKDTLVENFEELRDIDVISGKILVTRKFVEDVLAPRNK